MNTARYAAGPPDDGRPPGWFSRIVETSCDAWLVEGGDRWGRKVSHSGGNPDKLLHICSNDAKAAGWIE